MIFRTKFIGFVTLAAMGAIGIGQIYGWSSDGHQTVGALADGLIAHHRAAQQVASILGKAKKKQLTLSSVAVWADCIRSVHPEQAFKYIHDQYTDKACGIFEDKAGKTEMIAYAKRNNDNCQYDNKNQSCHKAFHFADIPIQREDYKPASLGANDHDIVHAIDAAIAVLQDKPSPAPFQIASKKEALMLLVHFVGDLHQPLHVGAIYLDSGGKEIDPTAVNLDETSTHGGNSIAPGSNNLHHKWDQTKYLKDGAAPQAMVAAAEAMNVSAINLVKSPGMWASDTVLVADTKAFPGVKMGASSKGGWPLVSDSTGRPATQKDQVVKAGARLAALLEALWPDS